jgi:GT2 family glycosyltransferase
MVKICVIVIHHRGKVLLDQCLRSLIVTRGVELEVLVVENACTESLPAIIDREATIHSVQLPSPVGFSEANNIGVEWAQTRALHFDYYMFLNNDTKVEPDTLQRLAKVAEALPECGVVGPRLMILGTDESLNSLGLNVTRTGEAWDEGIGVSLDDYGALPNRGEVLAVTGAALMIRADLCEMLRGWSELYEYYFEDIDLCLRARSRGWKVVLEPDAIVWHAISATTARDSDFKLHLTWRNRLLLVAAHWPIWLLCRVVPRLAFDEFRILVSRIRAKAFDDARLQVRAWVGAARCLRGVVSIRRHRGKRRGWTKFLRPAGTVPVIRLPELPNNEI